MGPPPEWKTEFTTHTHLPRYLTYVLSNKTSHHHALRVDEEVGLSLCGSAQSHLLETQLVVSDVPHLLRLKSNM